MTKIFILVIFPFILLALPANTFDQGHYTICIFKLLSGTECFACGLTRACMHLIHLDFAKAAYYNKISFIVLPILCGLLVTEILKTWRQYKRIAAGKNAIPPASQQ